MDRDSSARSNMLPLDGSSHSWLLGLGIGETQSSEGFVEMGTGRGHFLVNLGKMRRNIESNK